MECFNATKFEFALDLPLFCLGILRTCDFTKFELIFYVCNATQRAKDRLKDNANNGGNDNDSDNDML